MTLTEAADIQDVIDAEYKRALGVPFIITTKEKDILLVRGQLPSSFPEIAAVIYFIYYDYEELKKFSN